MITRDFTATTFVVQQHRTLLLFHRKLQMWLPPGGHIDPHELPHDAAIREVREETGLDVQLTSCGSHENITPDHQHIDFIYFALVVGGTLNPSIRESTGVRWVDTHELAATDIAEDIRVLGRAALAAVQ